MINNVSGVLCTQFPIDDDTLICDKEDQICVYNEYANGAVFTNKRQFESLIEDFQHKSETELGIMGTKNEFLSYIETRLKIDGKYFHKNPGKLTLKHQRYQNYCAGMIVHTALKHVVNGDAVWLVAASEFKQLGIRLELFNHDPICLKKPH